MSLRPALALALALAALLASACAAKKEGDAAMRPGENCLSCHGDFTAAGTVYASATAAAGEGVAGVTVTLDGSSVTDEVTTNAAGNFYSKVALGFPVVVTVSKSGSSRSMTATAGGCATSGCHDSAMRIHVP